MVLEPNKIWVSDITYVSTKEGFLYLTTVIDLFNREIISHVKSLSLRAVDTVIPALREAYMRKRPKEGLIFHSDRGSQYACNAFRNLLSAYSMKQSMSGKGNCYDNAVSESFFKTLKSELIYLKGGYKTRAEAKRDIFDYIECFYNSKRLHSSLGYETPRGYLEKGYRKFEKCA